jgi:pimeloyl-ACP methyl ester carboxylesterase
VELVATRILLAGSIAAGLVTLTSGCSADDGETPTRSSSESPAPTTDTTASTATDDLVLPTEHQIDIGGRDLYLRCWNEPVAGRPTILLIAGADGDTSSWDTVAYDLAAEGQHLCAYDRAGVGASDPPPEGRRTMPDLVDDLVALLDAADVQEPVVVVAHSIGSLTAVGLVARAPARVAGVVLVDPLSPRVNTVARAALPPRKPGEPPALSEERRFLTEFLYDPTQNREHLLLAKCESEIAALLDVPGPIFGKRPVVVLTAPRRKDPLPGLPRPYHEAFEAAIVAGNEEFAAESTRGRLINVEDTSHYIQDDQQEVVEHAILDVLAG